MQCILQIVRVVLEATDSTFSRELALSPFKLNGILYTAPVMKSLHVIAETQTPVGET